MATAARQMIGRVRPAQEPPGSAPAGDLDPASLLFDQFCTANTFQVRWHCQVVHDLYLKEGKAHIFDYAICICT